jgi:SpoVK/Ycf46/Vps4 family AAA+-type ATPase
MMFITLTNASTQNKGKKITLNADLIVSIWRGEVVRAADEDGNITEKEEVTLIFIPPHGTWEVEETHEEVLAQLAA